MGDDVTTVKVTVRSRPFNDKEKKEGAAQCLQFHCSTNQISYSGKQLFAFDNVLDPNTTQEVSYMKIGKEVVERFCKGFNCTMLAYGQTGSGKTFSMGTEETTKSMRSESRGIIPRLVEDLFLWIDSQDCPTAYTVFVSMLEIYEEKVNDLLAATKSNTGLQIREQEGQVLVPGLSKIAVKSFENTMEQLERGCKLRSKGETAMNATSSRSHAIFTIFFEKAAVTEEDTKFSAKLNLVDLAGSERLKKTMAEGERMREGISINSGLLVLGNVISALSEPNAANRHIPYRDSKITRLLQDALGGNSFTVMIACVSPADLNGEETLSTLRYADRAKKIKNKPIINVDPDQKIIKQLREQVAAQQRELSMFRAGITPSSNGSVDPDSAAELARLKEQLAESEQKLIAVQLKVADNIVQKMAMDRQLMKLEEEKEKLAGILALVPADVMSEDSEENDAEHEKVDVVAILKQINDVFHPKDDDMHQRTMSPSPFSAADDTAENGELLDENGDIDCTVEANYVDRQNQYAKDYEDIMSQLRAKEQAMQLTARDQASYDKLMEEHRHQVCELTRKIEELMAERERQSAEMKKTSNCGKIAEERRRRLQEVEKQLQIYKKQMNEYKRMEKQQKDNEEALKKMRNDISQLKQIRVRMMKQSRDDAEKFRVWKMKADKQLAQMKSKERKREAQIQRETRTKEQQMAVLKQKLEESKRVCKRLEMQRSRTGQLPEEKTDGKTMKTIKAFLVEELSLVTSSYEAEQLCHQMKEQRRGFSTKLRYAEQALKQLKGEEEPVQKKRRATDEGASIVSIDEAAIAEKQKEVDQLTEELNLCNQQLKDLQTGSAIDLDARATELWKNVHTVSYAINTIKSLFDLARDGSKTLVEKDFEIKALKEKIAEHVKTEKEQLRTIKELKAENQAMQNNFRDQNRALAMENDSIIYAMNQKYSDVLSNMTPSAELTPEQLQQFEQLKKSADLLMEQSQKLDSSRNKNRGPRVSHVVHRLEVDGGMQVDGPRTRKSTKLYGDTRDSLKAIEAGDDTMEMDQNSIMDTTYEVSNSSKEKPLAQRKATRAKKVMPSDLPSPIPLSRTIQSPQKTAPSVDADTGDEKGTISFVPRRNSQLYLRPPSPLPLQAVQPQVLAGISETDEMNSTFVKDEQTNAPNSTFVVPNEGEENTASTGIPADLEKSMLSSSGGSVSKLKKPSLPRPF